MCPIAYFIAQIMMNITPIAKMIYPTISGNLSPTFPSVQLANGIATIMIPITARIRPVTHRLPVDMVDNSFSIHLPVFCYDYELRGDDPIWYIVFHIHDFRIGFLSCVAYLVCKVFEFVYLLFVFVCFYCDLI